MTRATAEQPPPKPERTSRRRSRLTLRHDRSAARIDARYRYSGLAGFAVWLSRIAAHPLSFVIVGILGIVWLAVGPLSNFDSRLAEGFGVVTTVITFFLLFVIQHTQNRAQSSIQLKLNELLRSSATANDVLLDIEDLQDRDLERIKSGYAELAQRAREEILHGDRQASTSVQELTTLALLVDPSGALSDTERLHAVRLTGMMGTPAEPFFDQLTEAAKIALAAPIALLTFLEQDRQFLKSCFGLPEAAMKAREVPASASFCQYTLTKRSPVVISDLRNEAAVSNNPYVTAGLVLAYCGVPLVVPRGAAVGTLCVMDHRPRAWSDDQVSLLLRLAAVAVIEIDRRSASR